VVDDEGVSSLRVYNHLGRFVYENNREESVNYGIDLEKGGLIIGTLETDEQQKTHISGVAYTYDGQSIAFDDVKIFANEWFVLKIKETNKLFRSEGLVMAEGFDKAMAFESGYALSFGDRTIWKTFARDGYYFTEFRQVAGFFGDGCVLVKNDDQKTMTLKNITGQKLTQRKFVAHEYLSPDRFALTTDTGLTFMYDKNGFSKTVETQNADFLADGSFVSKWDNNTLAVYNKSGILDKYKSPIVHFEAMEYYYLIDDNGVKGRLFDVKGTELGHDFVLLKSAENFALFEQEDEVKLFNQFGLVLTLKKAS